MQFTVERGGPLLPFLLEHVKGSRNHVKSLLARGQVQVDGAAVRRHDHPLAPGQRVSVLAQGAEARRAPFPVLYEDGRILVIDKPSGLLSMASDREKVRTAYRMAGEYVRRTRPGGGCSSSTGWTATPPACSCSPKTRRPSGPIRSTGTRWCAAGAIWRWWRAGPPGRRTPSAPFCGRTPPTRSTPSAPAARRR